MGTGQRLEVVDGGQALSFSYDDLLRYSGPGSPAGVALAFKAMELAFPVLSPHEPPERRLVTVDTAFRGPGARDGFELVTRAVTEGRYVVDSALERPDRGTTLEQFVFRPGYGDKALTILVRAGQVSDEFVAMARKPDRSEDDEARFTAMKRDMAARLLASHPDEIFEVED